MGAFEDLVLGYIITEEPKRITTTWFAGRDARNRAAASLAAMLIETATKDFIEPNVPMGFSDWHKSLPFREAVIKYGQEVEPIIRQYGPSSRWAVLYLHPEAPTPAVTEVCSMLGMTGNRPSLVLLANEPVLARQYEVLEREGFRFLSDWWEPEGKYAKMLAAAEKYGRVYEMVRLGRSNSWGFAEKPLLDDQKEKYRATASARQPEQQLCLFRKEELAVLLRGAG